MSQSSAAESAASPRDEFQTAQYQPLRELFRSLVEGSRAAASGVRAGVVAQPRSGSKFLYGVLLNALEDDVFVFHCHGISQHRIEHIKKHGAAKTKDTATLEKARAITEALAGEGETFVFVPYRDPLARIYSAYVFEQFCQSDGWVSSDRADAKAFQSAEWTQAHFTQYVQNQVEQLERWFHWEIETALGVPLERLAPVSSAGFSVTDAGRVKVILLRLEDLATCLDAALFSQYPVREERRFKLVDGKRVLKYGVGRTNSAAERGYEPLYKAFRQKFRLPAGLIERLYSMPESRLFHSRR